MGGHVAAITEYTVESAALAWLESLELQAPMMQNSCCKKLHYHIKIIFHAEKIAIITMS